MKNVRKKEKNTEIEKERQGTKKMNSRHTDVEVRKREKERRVQADKEKDFLESESQQ